MANGKKFKDGSHVAASIFIYDAENLTKSGKREIYRWMRRQADFLLNHNKELAKTYRARYLYSDGN